MTLDQFDALLDRHGARPEQWPGEARDAARQLLASSPAAAARLAEAERIERLMRGFDPGKEVGHDALLRLSNSVFARLPAKPVRRRPWWWAALDHLGTALGAGQEWGPRVAVSVAAAAILGLVTGGLLPTGESQTSSAVELLAMSNPYSPLDAR